MIVYMWCCMWGAHVCVVVSFVGRITDARELPDVGAGI